jgi:hypothetical protein
MTPEEYKLAFEKHNIRPIRGIYLATEYGKQKECVACAIGIRLMEIFNDLDEIDKRLPLICDYRGLLCEWSELSPEFVGGLDAGWEGMWTSNYDVSIDYAKGYTEGRLARELLVNE